ncbi:tRNA-splicing endonuclease subunit Sen2 [Pleurostoma richardsiae]|uniref:tRNA-intron lyase n=1 Tax=Pleurostoma richardsiae TaxID=41990 RepID=A0AA38VBZ1_9PEZI|nr:tRNA-splicing endonuclease subunit Sen2 [Pleurostoma richardsiae]
MDDTSTSTPAPIVDRNTSPSEPADSPPVSRPKQVPPHQVYVYPLPIRTFPLPAFHPDNALLSVFHVALSWLKQTLSPPQNEPSVVHVGVWSPELRAVRVSDPEAMQALWTQGFFGKGSLSRSEPSWLKREQIRAGLVEGKVSEQVTDSRRRERFDAKWDRARAEQEAIEKKRAEEAALAGLIINGTPESAASADASIKLEAKRAEEAALANFIVNGAPKEPVDTVASARKMLHQAPVGPLELLALPNSDEELAKWQASEDHDASISDGGVAMPHVVEDSSRSNSRGSVNGLSNGLGKAPPPSSTDGHSTAANGCENGATIGPDPTANGSAAEGSAVTTSPIPPASGTVKRRKSVRFSPKVESTTFLHSDPPSPNESATSLAKKAATNGTKSGSSAQKIAETAVRTSSDLQKTVDMAPAAIENKEHLQLAPEEAFFLVFALGALRVLDPETNQPLSTEELFNLFRQHSYFPPRITDAASELQPDDPFLMHYVVYHHFRSLGWVPRPGIKFGVDWMLYDKGPVFSHAEFGLLVLPSYSSPEWKEQGRQAPRRSWHWLHGINRVLSHVLKSLVLVYVDVPPPSAFEKSDGIASILKQYKVREIMVRRWSSNRNR